MDSAALHRRLHELIESEQTKLRDYFERQLPSSEDPDDAVQETLVRAFRKMSAVYDESAFLPWLWGIASYVVRDIRKVALRRKKRIGELVEPDERSGETTSQPEANERNARLRGALAQLDDEERQVVELNVFTGLTHAQIAQALGWNISKVKNRSRTANARLQDLLKDVEF